MKRRRFSVQQESQEIAGQRSVWVGIFALLVGAVGVAGSAALWVGSSRYAWRKPLEPLPESSPLERGSIDVEERGLTLRRKARDELASFAWVDEEQGIVAIPIEDAMQWFVESEGKAAPASADPTESAEPPESAEPTKSPEEKP